MIQITIQPGTAGEMSLIARALCAVLDLREGAPAVPATAVEVGSVNDAPAPAIEEKPRKTRAKKVEQAEPAPAVEQAEPEPAVEQAEPEPAVEEAPVEQAEQAPAPEAAKPTVTLEVVRSLAAGLSQQGKAAQVKQAIADLGAARLTDLDPSDFPALHKALLAL